MIEWRKTKCFQSNEGEAGGAKLKNELYLMVTDVLDTSTSQIISLGSKSLYLLNQLAGPVLKKNITHMRDIYMTTKQLKKNRSKQICQMKTMTWADSHDTRRKSRLLGQRAKFCLPFYLMTPSKYNKWEKNYPKAKVMLFLVLGFAH